MWMCCGLIWFGEVAGKFSFPVDAAKWVCGEAVPQTRRQPKLLRGKCYIPIHAPYTHTPPPRSSSSRLGGKKKCSRTFNGKVLNGEKRREGERKKRGERVTKYGTAP